VEKRLPYIIQAYPHLAKNVHAFCAHISDKEAVADMIISEVVSRDRMMEYQLFRFCSIFEEQLMNTSKASSLLSVLFNHRSATAITKAKILESPDMRFGLQDLRNKFLMNGQFDWLAWASAVGSRSQKPISKNHRLRYFGNASQMNHLIATVMLKA
jgi:hypothetical protein